MQRTRIHILIFRSLQGMPAEELDDFNTSDMKATALAVLRGEIDLHVPSPEENAIEEMLNVKVDLCFCFVAHELHFWNSCLFCHQN